MTCESIRIHEAYKKGDLEALKDALGNPPDFPNCPGPDGMGDVILEYAIYHSPISFIRKLLELGADPNYESDAGFPSLIATLSCGERGDMLEILELLLSYGGDVQQRGINDYTPLHYAAGMQDETAIKLLFEYGADPKARTRIDEYATPLEEAEILGLTKAAEILRKYGAG